VSRLTVSTPSDTEVVMTREFDAPRERVFAAFTTPDLLRRWYGARGWTIVECAVDLRPGGSWRFVWTGPGGAGMASGGVYREVVPPRRLVLSEAFDDGWYPGESVVTHTFAAAGVGRTRLTTTIAYPSRRVRDIALGFPMARGVEEGYERLEEMFSTEGFVP
jgi:uncharacterized protein YndB with AHSA1/START domain